MIRGDFLFFYAPLRRTNFFFFFWTYSFSNGISFAASTFLLAVYYMWILIRDHGRLRVPRQAKFLSCKYSIYWP